jgi:hypothetical protein
VLINISQFKAEFTAKHGKITELSVEYNDQVQDNFLESSLLNRELHKVIDWENIFRCHVDVLSRAAGGVSPGKGMNKLFGAGSYEPSDYIT